jgi:hypothetical protein
LFYQLSRLDKSPLKILLPIEAINDNLCLSPAGLWIKH